MLLSLYVVEAPEDTTWEWGDHVRRKVKVETAVLWVCTQKKTPVEYRYFFLAGCTKKLKGV